MMMGQGQGQGLMNHHPKSDQKAVLKRSSTLKLKKLFSKAMRNSILFKSKKSRPKTPVDVVRQTTLLLSYLNSASHPHPGGHKHADKVFVHCVFKN